MTESEIQERLSERRLRLEQIQEKIDNITGLATNEAHATFSRDMARKAQTRPGDTWVSAKELLQDEMRECLEQIAVLEALAAAYDTKRPQEPATATAPLSELVESQEPNLFRLEGDYWTVRFGGKTARLRNLKRLRMIILLLEHAGQQIRNRDLVTGADNFSLGVSEYSEIEAKKDLSRAEIDLIQESLEDILARIANSDDLEKKSGLQDQFEQHRKHLLDTYGLKINAKDGSLSTELRRAEGQDEKARKTVGNNLTNAWNDLSERFPELEAHLRKWIQRKEFYTLYDPIPPVNWEFIH